jgi:hypothetical protein
MAIAGNFLKVTLSGKLFGSVQTWSTSFWFQSPTAYSLGDAQATANGAGDVRYTGQLQTVLKSMMISTCTLDKITYRIYQPDSATLFDEGFKTYADNGTGTGGQAAQVALVATLVTDGFGRAYRGRSYLPATGCVVGTGSTTVTPTATAVAQAVRNYLQSFIAISANPILLSRSRNAYSLLSKVSVGQVFDTQRRRRDKLGEGTRAVIAI